VIPFKVIRRTAITVKMKLLGGLTLLCYFSHASAACSENLRRNHCLGETNCVWLRRLKRDGHVTIPGECKHVDNVGCQHANNNKKLCKKLNEYNLSDYPCYFDPEWKGCSTTKPYCSWMGTHRGCNALKKLGDACWWREENETCVDDSDKDDCSRFNSWRWGCHNKARANCVYRATDDYCVALSESQCYDYNGSRYRCRKDQRCEWKNNTCNSV